MLTIFLPILTMTMHQPLADRMRPKRFEEYFGQEHLVAEGAVFRKNLEAGRLHSFILWGPPGVGKTTLAQLIATQQNRPFFTLSAINSGVKEVREVIDKANRKNIFDKPGNPILFIDEIHRFNKAQQDSLLGAVEQGVFTLIGATTENPSFEVIAPLLSRCQVYILKPLLDNDIKKVIQHAIATDQVLKKLIVEVDEWEALLHMAQGDARKALNILEIVTNSTGENDICRITNQQVSEQVQKNIAFYDKNGEMHYDIISAFIKSVRGSDPHAAVYWLARMVEAGEDPKFIARRLLILAAEDIGLANPNALLMANACFQSVHIIGWPESRIILSEATIYLATSPKSNAAYLAINEAQELVRSTGDLSVPLHIRNAPTKLMKNLEYGQGYKYAHDYGGNFVHEEFLPEPIRNTILYKPQENQRETELDRKLREQWKNKYYPA